MEVVLESFGSNDCRHKRYIDFVNAGLSMQSPRSPFSDETILGSPAFLALHAGRARQQAIRRRVPSFQSLVDRPPLDDLLGEAPDRKSRKRAAALACLVHGYRMTEIAEYLGLHYTTVSRWIHATECDNS